MFPSCLGSFLAPMALAPEESLNQGMQHTLGPPHSDSMGPSVGVLCTVWHFAEVLIFFPDAEPQTLSY